MGTQLAILGAGGTSRFMREVALRTGRFEDVFLLDDDPSKQQTCVDGVRVHGDLESWVDLDDQTLFLSSLYAAPDPARLPGRVERLGIPAQRWATVIDPSAVVSAGTALGPGVLVGPHSTLEPGIRIGARTIIAENSIVGHDTTFGTGVFCASSAAVGSRVVVGDRAFLGMGCRVMNGVRIGRAGTVGLGSVLLRDVAAGDAVMGNPARPLPRRSDRTVPRGSSLR